MLNYANNTYKQVYIYIYVYIYTYGSFLKCCYTTTIGFPTKNDHFGGVLGIPPFKETPIYIHTRSYNH